MAFNIKRSDTFKRVVNVELPTDDPKKPRRGHFTVEYKYHEREAANDLAEKLKAGELDDAAMLDRVVVKFYGIGDDDGEYSQEQQRKAVYSDIGICRLVFEEFFKGNSEASRKN